MGKWVDNQRQLNKKGKLPHEHTTQLKGAGFVWKIKTGRKQKKGVSLMITHDAESIIEHYVVELRINQGIGQYGKMMLPVI